jgi:hypothetical protein
MNLDTYDTVEDTQLECVEPEINFNKEYEDKKWKTYKFSSLDGKLEDQYGIFRIIKLELTDNTNLPVLVAMAGFSTKSFCGSSNVIIKNLRKIKDKFKCIYILKYDEDKIKILQKKACDERDEIKKNTLNHHEIYKPEIDLNEELGIIIDKLLRSMKLINVHLLGKCAGGGVAIHIFTKSEIYNALYLAVPASPTNVEHLLENKAIMKNKTFILAWNSNDDYKFNWGGKSNDELSYYSNTIQELAGNENKIIFDSFNEQIEGDDPKRFHEIPNGLFRLIRDNLSS